MTPIRIPLGEIMATKAGSVDPAKFPEEVFDLYSIPAFEVGKPEVVAGAAIGSAKQVVKPGDILLSKIVPHIRRSWVVGDSRGRRIIASGEWIVFRSDKVDPAYLKQVLVSDPFHAQFMSTVSGVGGSLLRARPAYVAKIEIPLPPLPEQGRIAEVLDRAEALRAKRRAALAEVDGLAQAIFLTMFGDPGSNVRAWPVHPMADLFSIPPNFGTMIPPAANGGEWLSLRVGNIQSWQLDLSDKKFVNLSDTSVRRHSVADGDLVMARAIASQEHLGKAIITYPGTRKWAFDSHLMRLRFDKKRAEPEYVRHLLQTPGGRSLFLKAARRSAVQFNINTKEISNLRLPVPPIDLQREFARHTVAVERMKAAQRASLAEMDALFASLQHRAFRGEL